MTFIVPHDAKVGDRIGPSKIWSPAKGCGHGLMWIVVKEEARTTPFWVVCIGDVDLVGCCTETEAEKEAAAYRSKLAPFLKSLDAVTIVRRDIHHEPYWDFETEYEGGGYRGR